MKYCIYCGKQIKENAAFCPYCGQEQVIREEEQDDSAEGYFSAKKKIVLAAVFLCLAVAVFILVVMKADLLHISERRENMTAESEADDEKVYDEEEYTTDQNEPTPDETDNITAGEDENTHLTGDADLDENQANTAMEDNGEEIEPDPNTAEEKVWTLEELEQYHNFTGTEVSSVLAAQSGNTYEGYNLVDGDDETAWVEGVSGYGEGEWVELKADSVNMVYGVAVKNGYIKSDKTLTINAQVKSVRIETAEGEQEYTLQKSDGTDGAYSDVLWFDEPVKTDFVRLTILSVYQGSDYTKTDGSVSKKCEDTCISEINVLGYTD